MIKTLLRQIGEYKRDTIITPIFTVLEVVAELLVPFVIAALTKPCIRFFGRQFMQIKNTRNLLFVPPT